MSSPFGAVDPAGTTHDVYTVVIEPHVGAAIWAIVLAIVCALMLMVIESVKARSPQSERRRGRKPPRN
jgi:hypothetical protein